MQLLDKRIKKSGSVEYLDADHFFLFIQLNINPFRYFDELFLGAFFCDYVQNVIIAVKMDLWFFHFFAHLPALILFSFCPGFNG
jgi:hypothetical protein